MIKPKIQPSNISTKTCCWLDQIDTLHRKPKRFTIRYIFHGTCFGRNYPAITFYVLSRWVLKCPLRFAVEVLELLIISDRICCRQEICRLWWPWWEWTIKRRIVLGCSWTLILYTAWNIVCNVWTWTKQFAIMTFHLVSIKIYQILWLWLSNIFFCHSYITNANLIMNP